MRKIIVILALIILAGGVFLFGGGLFYLFGSSYLPIIAEVSFIILLAVIILFAAARMGCAVETITRETSKECVFNFLVIFCCFEVWYGIYLISQMLFIFIYWQIFA